MLIAPAASSGLALVHAGRARLDASVGGAALPEAAVQQVLAQHEVALGARVLRTSDEVLGALLDVRA